jgi:EpsD family peptidyl-prolyl cis-trans isomerase
MEHSHLPNKISRSQCVATGLGLALALAGCGDRQPEGQTAAVVNGEPITETAVNMEVAASNNQMTPQQALNALIDRALIVEQAKRQKLDQRPQYTLEVRRMSDLLLSRQYAEKMAQSSGNALTDLDVNSYLTSHPEIGSKRRRVTLKQAIFAEPTNPRLRADLEAAKSYAALIAVLQAHQVKFEEGSTTIDSAFAAEPFLKAMASTEPGEPFIIMADGRALANAVDHEVPVEMSQEQELALARGRMQQASLSKTLEQLMKSWKKQAKIKYGAKYKPVTSAVTK